MLILEFLLKKVNTDAKAIFFSVNYQEFFILLQIF